MNRVAITKTLPHFTDDTLFFDVNNCDMEDFLRIVAGQGYYVIFGEDEETNE